MDYRLRQFLTEAADRHENATFIATDPIQFPHRYTDRRDIEVSAFVSAWMAYGSRKVFLDILNKLHLTMDARGGPSSYIAKRAWLADGTCRDERLACCLYRFYKWRDFASLCERLHRLYAGGDSIESVMDAAASAEENVRRLCSYFEGVNGVPVPGSTSANKRLHMFLRWLVRKKSPVDFGLWEKMTPAQLVIPLDTHVYQTALGLGLTSRRSADLKTAVQITDAMREIWPDDPARGDFALYGLGLDGFGTVCR